MVEHCHSLPGALPAPCSAVGAGQDFQLSFCPVREAGRPEADGAWDALSLPSLPFLEPPSSLQPATAVSATTTAAETSALARVVRMELDIDVDPTSTV